MGRPRRRRNAAPPDDLNLLLASFFRETTDAVFMKDRSGRYLVINAVTASALGRMPAEVVGKRDEEIVLAEQARRVTANDAEVLEKGVITTFEETMTTGDGTRVFLTTKGPVRDRRGRVLGVFGVARDVTALRRAEAEERAAREQAERRLAFLYQATTTLLAEPLDVDARMIDFATQIVAVLADLCCVHFMDGEPTRQIVLHREPPGGARIDVFERRAPDPIVVPPCVAETMAAGEAKLLSGVPPLLIEACAIEAVERLLRSAPTSVIVAPIRARGRTYGALTLVAVEPRRYDREDVALAAEVAYRAALAMDNARLYQEAERAARAREDLNTVVAHDLRNALGAIGLGADVLARSTQLTERDRAKVLRIQRGVTSMDRLMRSVLDAGAIEAGRLTLNVVSCDPAAPVREAVEAMAPLAEHRGLALTADVPDDAPRVACDHERILQVLSNLIGNALKFTEQGGVRVSARPDGAEVIFSVTDTGAGIRPEALPHVFDRFWQERETAHKGSGLGLFVVRGIVEAHGGRVWAESPPGEGATFSFTLPIAAR